MYRVKSISEVVVRLTQLYRNLAENHVTFIFDNGLRVLPTQSFVDIHHFVATGEHFRLKKRSEFENHSSVPVFYFCTSPSFLNTMSDSLFLKYVDGHHDKYINNLADVVAIPS